MRWVPALRVVARGDGLWLVAMALLSLAPAACGPRDLPPPTAIPPPVPTDNTPAASLPAQSADEAPPAARPRSPLPEQARALVDRLEADFPGSAESLFACGEILELFGQSDEAIWCWRMCLAVDPADSQAHEQIGLVHFKRGEFNQAVLRLRRASQIDPNLPDAGLQLGRALLNLGRYPEAVAVLGRQTELQPRAAEGWCRLGQAYQESGDQERAQKCFLKAIEAFPDCTPAWLGAARAYEELGQLEKAREHRRRFHELDEKLTASDRESRRANAYSADREKRWLAQACAIAARVYTMHEEIESARDLWKRAIELDERNLSYRQALGQCLARKREFADEALAVFADLQRREPANPDHLLASALLHQKLKQLDFAESELEQAMQVAPQDPRAAIRLARLYLTTGKELPKGQRLAERVVQIQPTAENFFLLGSLCRANGDSAGSRAALQEAVRLAPQNPQYAAAARELDKE
jgi:tetratricopeptide (TPR) repeat protein